MLRPFRLEEPESVKEVSELLGRFGEAAKVYAGGTELLLAMKEGLVHYERLINVKNVKGLNEVTSDDGLVRIGALLRIINWKPHPYCSRSLPRWCDWNKTSPMFEFGRLGRWRQSLLCRTPPIREYCCWPSTLRWLSRRPVRSAKFPRRNFCRRL